tara:strand:+ start:242 stop:499 length:258 start_codon:yes stop_codon:yes gene_type:complete
MNSNKQNLINKIKYRSLYRGTKEMDLFVNTFVDEIVKDLNFNELVELNRLINLNDEEIDKISKGKSRPDIDNKICELLVNFKKKY